MDTRTAAAQPADAQAVAEACRDAMWKDDRASRMLGMEVSELGEEDYLSTAAELANLVSGRMHANLDERQVDSDCSLPQLDREAKVWNAESAVLKLSRSRVCYPACSYSKDAHRSVHLRAFDSRSLMAFMLRYPVSTSASSSGEPLPRSMWLKNGFAPTTTHRSWLLLSRPALDSIRRLYSDLQLSWGLNLFCFLNQKN